MKCPVCEERMREVEKNGVTLDVCPGCKGVWLDRGELEKLLELSAAGGTTRPETGSPGYQAPRPYEGRDEHGRESREHDSDHDRRESGERGYGERKKKGSWLGDIIGGFGGGDD